MARRWRCFTAGNGRSRNILCVRLWDLSAGDWRTWQTSYPPEDMVRAEEDWEGDVVHDSYAFKEDGQLYLFYTCWEEDAIAVAKLYRA